MSENIRVRSGLDRGLTMIVTITVIIIMMTITRMLTTMIGAICTKQVLCTH